MKIDDPKEFALLYAISGEVEDMEQELRSLRSRVTDDDIGWGPQNELTAMIDHVSKRRRALNTIWQAVWPLIRDQEPEDMKVLNKATDDVQRLIVDAEREFRR